MLELPDWLPHAVRDKALSIFAALTGDDDEAAENKELLIRLASDSRMMDVWQELYKYKRVSNKST
jgi:hypothetical protein